MAHAGFSRNVSDQNSPDRNSSKWFEMIRNVPQQACSLLPVAYSRLQAPFKEPPIIYGAIKKS